LHRIPMQTEIELGRHAGLHTGVKAPTTVRVSDRDADGSEMATVSRDQSTIGVPAGVPTLSMGRHNAIHAVPLRKSFKERTIGLAWMPGTRPGMTS
jgi:hypothetical protein